MAPATLIRARSLAFRLAPEEQIELAHDLVNRVTHLPATPSPKPSVARARKATSKLAKAVGAPLSGKGLDTRLKNAISGKEKGIPASAAIAAIRKRLGL